MKKAGAGFFILNSSFFRYDLLMRKTMLALPLVILAACAGPEAGPAMTETEFETRIASRLIFDPALSKVGERVIYFVKRSGDPQIESYSWACVNEESGAVWIENKLPHQPRPVIYKSKISREGKLIEQHVGEPGSPQPLKIWPREGAAPGVEAVVRRDSESATGASKEEPDTITVGGRPYGCTRVTTTLTYPDGRKSTMVNWFSKDVPFASKAAQGGLVKRQFGRLTMELAVFDVKGAPVELQLPAAAPK